MFFEKNKKYLANMLLFSFNKYGRVSFMTEDTKELEKASVSLVLPTIRLIVSLIILVISVKNLFGLL